MSLYKNGSLQERLLSGGGQLTIRSANRSTSSSRFAGKPAARRCFAAIPDHCITSFSLFRSLGARVRSAGNTWLADPVLAGLRRFEICTYHQAMTMSRPTGKYDLRSIAQEAMSQHGLLPDFSEAALAEARKITGAAVADRQRRSRPAPVALGLDRQRRFSRPRSVICSPAARPGYREILVAIADVDGLVRRFRDR